MKRKPTERAQPWQEHRHTLSNSIDGTTVCRMPVNATPALIRPGMVVSICNVCEDAEVVQTTADFCIVRTEKGQAWALYWHEVQVVHCAPDPAHLSRAA